MALDTHRLQCYSKLYTKNCIAKCKKNQVVREQKFKDPQIAHERLAHKGEC